MNRKWILLAVAVLLALAGLAWFSKGGTHPEPYQAGSASLAPRAVPAQAEGVGPLIPRPRLPAIPRSDAPGGAPSGLRLESLLVRDSVTKAHLAGARVFAHLARSECALAVDPRPDIPWDETPDPACLFRRSPLGVTDASGRLQVPAENSLLLHVVAAGHRWGRPRIGEGGVVADLRPGGAVRLSIGSWEDLEEPLVFAERGAVAEGVDPAVPADVAADLAVFESWRPVHGPEPGAETTLDEGLEPGTWTYYVRRGMRDGEEYARGIVTVYEGEMADLRLDAVPLTAGPRFPVKAVVHVPAGWHATDFDVEVAQDAFIADPGPYFALLGLDPLNRHLEATCPYVPPGPDGLWHFALKPDLPAGRYRATVGPMGWVTDVEVSGPAPEVRIELPEPGEVRVTILDATTRKPVPKGWVQWAPEWRGLPRGQMETVWVVERTGIAVLVAPAGTLHADIGADGYLDGARDLFFVAGSTAEVKVELRPAAVLVVRLRVDGEPYEGKARVEATMKADAEELRRLSGESGTGGVVTSQASGLRDGEFRFDGLWGGPHEITVTGIKGFEPVPARRVDLRVGTGTEVEIDLVRAK